MKEYAKMALGPIGNMSFEEFEKDHRTNLAISRCIEIIGEAAGHIKPEQRKKLNDIPWDNVIGTRIIIAHAYMRIDLNIIYQIVKNDLSDLIKQIDKILDERK